MKNNIDEDISFIKEMVKEYRTFGDLYNSEYEDTEKIYKAISNVLSELETYKKIAEKLAEQIDETNVNVKVCEERIECNENCKQCIIDWARKEVEKDDNRRV